MPGWQNSDRRDHLPPGWAQIRRAIFKRDGHRCTARDTYGERCPEPADEVDHLGRRTDHRPEMLTSLCSWHHKKKSSQQGAKALHKKRDEIDQRWRRHDPHPGFLGQ